MSHVGWSTSKAALYYLKLADVIRAGAPEDLLASALPQSQEASRVYEDYNALKDFVSAFSAPTLSSSKRSLHLSLSASSVCVHLNFTTPATYL